MIDGNDLAFTPYKDSRGNSGSSGQLSIGTAKTGKKYLVKSLPADVVTEFVAHRLATIIGVPTSDAVLIRNGKNVVVGIEYLEDFTRISMDDFLGTVQISGTEDTLHGEIGPPSRTFRTTPHGEIGPPITMRCITQQDRRIDNMKCPQHLQNVDLPVYCKK